MADFEPMQMFLIADNGTYGAPLPINSDDDLLTAVAENIEKFSELRVVDMNDVCTMQIINQSLIFPIPRGRTPNNRWCASEKKFIAVTAGPYNDVKIASIKRGT